MAFPNVNDIINDVKESIGNPLEDAAPEQAPDPVEAPAPVEALEPVAAAPTDEPKTEAEQIEEIEKLIGEKKFKLDGQDMTMTELKRAVMRQQDYTKKTQDLAKQRKDYETQIKQLDYYKNIDADMAAVRANPALISKFKEVYPKEFHNRVAELEAEQPWTEDRVQQIINSRLQERLSPLEESLNKRESDALVAQFESWDQELGKKYEYADTELAYAMIERAKADGTPLNKDTWEQAYKSAHDKIKGLADKAASARVSTKKQLNVAGKDTKSGGATPGQAPDKVSLKDAKNAWLAALGTQ